MEEKIDKLIQGQIKIQTKLESMEEKTNDQCEKSEQKAFANLSRNEKTRDFSRQ